MGRNGQILVSGFFLLAGVTVLVVVASPPHRWTTLALTALVVIFAVGYGMASAKYPLSAFEEFFAQASLTAPIVIWVIAAIAFGTAMGSKRTGSIEFDSVAAQVIPVLALALALQGRTFDIRVVRGPSDLYLMILTFAFLADGEFSALRSLYSSNPANADVIAAAITAGFAGLVLRGLGAGIALREAEPKGRQADEAEEEAAPPQPLPTHETERQEPSKPSQQRKDQEGDGPLRRGPRD